MSHSQFHCTGRVYLDLHGLIFETSICYWQDQPGSPRVAGRLRGRPPGLRLGESGCGTEPPDAAFRVDRQKRMPAPVLWRGDLGLQPRISGGGFVEPG